MSSRFFFFLDYCDIFGYGFGTSAVAFVPFFLEIRSNIFISVYITITASYSLFLKFYM